MLARDSRTRAVETQGRGRTDALLRGLLFGPTGEPMCPTFTRKNGHQYRYYFSRSESRYGAGDRTCARIPADQIETAAVAQLMTVLTSPEAIAAVCMALHRLGTVWEQLYPTERHRLVNLTIERIDLVPGGLKVKWRELGWKALIREFAPEGIGAELVAAEVASIRCRH